MAHKFLSLFVFIILAQSARATPELEWKFYSSKYIEISTVIRYENESQDLYYKTIVPILNDYINELKDKGELKRNKIHIEIMTAIWMDHAMVYICIELKMVISVK